jgi:hypothetical protein
MLFTHRKIQSKTTAYNFLFGCIYLYDETHFNERLKRNEEAGFHFPKTVLQIGYTTNALGYGVNNAVSKGPIPIFWGGEVRVKQGISVNYQHNIFHSRKVFSFDWGATLLTG